MKNNQVCELAHNWRTTGAPVRFKVRRFAPVRQLRQLLNNWQLERRNGPRPESTGKSLGQKPNVSKKIAPALAPPAFADPAAIPQLRCRRSLVMISRRSRAYSSIALPPRPRASAAAHLPVLWWVSASCPTIRYGTKSGQLS
jgi:hypothetical protein